jgi:poly-gamma-glutamate synthesis protein (capsule biosynthesis protein)
MKISKYFYFYTVVLLLLVSMWIYIPDRKARNPVQKAVQAIASKEDSIILIFGGDIMVHSPQLEVAFNPQTGRYDFTSCFQFFHRHIKSADLAVANLEVPLAGRPYSGYPCFSAPDALLDAVLEAGFDVMQLANNHVADRGKQGAKRTYETVNAVAKSVGIYPNLSVRDSIYPLMLDVKGLKLALLNCTYGTNGVLPPKPFVVNTIDTVQIRQDIVAARINGAKCVVMTIHWGDEYQLKRNQLQEKLARFFVNAGVDIIVGTHPHVVQNFELLQKDDSTHVPVFYSLGNMISNQRKQHSNGGILARIVLSKSTGRMAHIDYLPFYVHKGALNDKNQYYLLPTRDYLNNQLALKLPAKEEEELIDFDKNTYRRLANLKRWEE